MADIDRLTVVWDANFSKLDEKLNKLNSRVHTTATGIEKRLDHSFTAPNFGKAIERVFDSSKLAVIEQGSARLRVFGSALEPLGPLGLGVAAGVTAIAVALHGAGEAAEFARGVQDMAKRLHITTNELQEYDFAIKAAGGTTDGAHEALEQFGVSLGKAQEGLKKSKQAFHALGFSDAEIKSFKTVDEALRAVVGRIGELKNNPQKDAIIAQLGLEGLKPLIDEGLDKMEALKRKAEEIGVVMDADLVKKGAKANEEFETLSKVIDIQLKSALVDLAPELTKLLKIAVAFAREIADVVEGLTAIEHRTRSQLTRELNTQDEFIAKQTPNLESPLAPTRAFARGAITKAFEERAKIQAQLDKLGPATPDTPDIPTGNRSLLPPPSGAKGPNLALKALEERKKFADELAAIGLRQLAAEGNSLRSLQEYQDLQTDIVLATRQRRDADIDFAVQEFKLSKGARGLSENQARQIRAANALADSAEDHLRHFENTKATDEQAASIQQEQVQSQQELLGLQGDAAITAREKARIERQILDNAQRLARLVLEERIKWEPQFQGPEGAKLADQARADLTSIQSAQDTQFQLQHLTPLQQLSREVHTATDDMNAAFEGVAAHGLQTLEDGILGVITGAESMGQAFKRVLASILADLLKLQIEKSIIGPLSDALSFSFGSGDIFAGLATGTSYALGGPTWINEKGPELVTLPTGSKVMTAAATRKILDEAMRTRSQPRSAEVRTECARIYQDFNFPGANPDGFRKTRRQWAREAKQAMQF